jgi:hypothetical protein
MTHCTRPFQDCQQLCDQCSSPDRLTTINAKTRRQCWRLPIRQSPLAAMSFIIIFAAGYWGLSRAERAYQIERVWTMNEAVQIGALAQNIVDVWGMVARGAEDPREIGRAYRSTTAIRSRAISASATPRTSHSSRSRSGKRMAQWLAYRAGKEVRAEDIWTSCCRHPVTYESYNAAMEGKGWRMMTPRWRSRSPRRHRATTPALSILPRNSPTRSRRRSKARTPMPRSPMMRRRQRRSRSEIGSTNSRPS